MRFSGTRRARLIVAVALLAIVGGAAFHLYRQVMTVYGQAGPIILAWVQQHLGRELYVGRVEVTPGLVTLEDVRLARGKKLRQGEQARARRIEIRFNQAELLFGSRDVGASLDRVDVYDPQGLLVRNKDAKWDIANLFRRRPGQKPSRFRGDVYLHNVQGEIVDYRARFPVLPARNRVRNTDVALRFGNAPSIAFEANGTALGPHGGRARVSGFFNTRDKLANVTLHADTADGGYWYRYFAPDQRQFQLSGFRGKIALTLQQDGDPKKRQPSFQIQGQGSGVVARIPGLPVPVQGQQIRFTATNKAAWIDAKGTVDGAPVTVRGTIAPLTPAFARLTIGAREVTLARLQRLFPQLRLPESFQLTQPAAAELTLSGRQNEWIADGKFTAPAGVFRETPFAEASGHFHFQDRFLQVDEFRAHAFAGQLTGRGWMDLREEPAPLYLAGQLRGVELASIAPGSSQQIAGQARGDFLLTGTAEAPTVSAYLHASPVRVNDYAFDSVEGRVRFAGDLLTVESATVTDRRGSATLSGTVARGGEIDLNVATSRFRLSAWLPSSRDVDALASFTGKVTGTFEQPTLAADTQLYDVKAGRYAAEYAAGSLVATRDRVELSGFELRYPPTVVSLQHGVLTRAPDGVWSLDAELSARDMALARALKLAGAEQLLEKEPLVGHVDSATVTLKGPVSQPRITYSVKASGLATRGLEIGTAQALGEVHLDQRLVRVARVEGGTGASRFAGGGEFRWREERPDGTREPGEYAFRVTAENLPLLPVLQRAAPDAFQYAEIEGDVRRLQLRVAGGPDALRLSGHLDTTPYRLNDHAFEPLSVDFGWQPGAVTLANLAISLQGGRVVIPHVSWLPAQDGPAPKTWEEFLPRLAGTMRLERVPLRYVRRLIADSPFAQTSAQGAEIRRLLAYVSPDVAGEVTGEIDLPAPQPLLPDAPAASVATVAAARASDPRIAVKVSIPDFATSGAAPERSPAGTVRVALEAEAAYARGRLDLRHLELKETGGTAYLVADGIYDQRGPTAADDTLQLNLDATGVNLATLGRIPIQRLREALAPYQPLEGTAEVHLVATGEASRPNVTLAAETDGLRVRGVQFAQLGVEDARIVVPETGTAAEKDARTQLHVRNAHVALAHTPVEKDGHEHRVQLDGTLPYSWALPGVPPDRQRNLAVDIPKQPVDVLNVAAHAWRRLSQRDAVDAGEQPFPALSATTGEFEGRVEFQGTANSPLNSGDLKVTNGTVRVLEGDTVFNNFQAHVSLFGNEIAVSKFEAESNRNKGRLVAGGNIILGRELLEGTPAQLDLWVEVNDFRVIEDHLERLFVPPGVKTEPLRVRGSLQTVDPLNPRVPQALEIRGPWPRPAIRGAVQVADGVLSLPTALEFASPKAESGLIPAPLDVDIVLGKNIRVTNPALQMTLEGRLHAGNTLAQPVIRGDLQVARGALTLPTMRFRMDGLLHVNYDGPARAANQAPPPALTVDLTARTRLRIRQPGETDPTNFEVTVEITGSPAPDGYALASERSGLTLPTGLAIRSGGGGLNLNIYTDPPLPTQQVEALIRRQLGLEGFATGDTNVETVLRYQVEQALAASVFPRLTGPLEEFIQERLGLDLSIDVGIEQPLQLRVSRRLFDRLYGSYSQQVGSRTETGQERAWELYYRLTPRFRVGYRDQWPERRPLFFLGGSFGF